MSDASPLEQEIRQLIEAFEGRVALLARNFSTGEEISHQPDQVMPTASAIKVLILAELFRQAEAGGIDLDRLVQMTPDDRYPNTSILLDLSSDLELRIRDHAKLMIALSEDTSTYLLVRLLGKEKILISAKA